MAGGKDAKPDYTRAPRPAGRRRGARLSGAGSSRGTAARAPSAACRRTRPCVASSTMRPWSMKITRCATLRAKPISCVTTIIVMPSFASCDHDVEHLVDHLRVERRRRLVEQHADRVHRQRPGDRDALLLAAGELARKLVLLRDGGRRGRAASGRARRASSLPRFSTLIWASVRFSVIDRCGKSSKCWNTMPTRARSLGRSVFGSFTGDAVDGDLALLERLQRVDALDQRRLARARGAADDDDLALLDLGRAVGQHLEAAVPLGDVGDGDHGHGGNRPSADDGDLLLQPLHAERQRVAEDEIDDGDEQVHLDQLAVALRDLGRGADEVGAPRSRTRARCPGTG